MKKKLLFAAGLAILVVLFWFAYYAVSPLFRNIQTDEPLPQAEMTNETPMADPMPGVLPNTSEDVEPIISPAVRVVDTPIHPAEGDVRLVSVGNKMYVRYENFKTINGPDLYVYLSKDIDAKEFVNLGRLKSTEGNSNYEIPAGTNVEDYQYVLVWCDAFSVLFNAADISTIR